MMAGIQQGTYSVPNGLLQATTTRNTAATTTLYSTRFYAPEDITVSSVAVYVTTAVAGGIFSMGIYSISTSSNAGSLITSAANLSCASTGRVTGSMSTTLTAGTAYAFSLASTSTTPAFAGMYVSRGDFYGGTTSGQWIALASTITALASPSYALPSSITYTSIPSGSSCVFFVINPL